MILGFIKNKQFFYHLDYITLYIYIAETFNFLLKLPYHYHFLYILALCPCNARFNQNSYVNNFFLLIYLKINNKNK